MFQEDDDEWIEPGSDRESVGSTPPLLQALIVTAAKRVLDELDHQDLLMEYLTEWDRNKQQRYAGLVMNAYQMINAPIIDDDVLDES